MPDTTPTIITPATSTSPATETKRKTFVPLENNPQVMTHLLHNLGLSPSLSLHDVFSLSDPEMLAFVPRPASALLLVFPVSEGYERYRREEDGGLEEYGGRGFASDAGGGKLGEVGGEGGGVLWFRQTIRNSCGLMALLHAAGNGSAREFVDPDSTLGKLLKEATPLAPTERAELLYNSPALEAAHSTSAQQGDTAAPPADDVVELHFVTFVVVNGKLWELDGRRKGPICRGEVGDGEDALGEKALEMGPRRFVGREEGELRFSVVALGPGLD
ncbi:hypothetical protein VF21_10269 [Pseudogymnoascus sp. 05NY08]|nr:hypothetical protein VF21_10269 [Pseudogymnoascus sp. 05NY08]